MASINFRWLTVFFLLLSSSTVFAVNNCNNLFNNGLQTHGIGTNADSNIEFSCNANIVSASSSVLPTKEVINPCKPTCTTGNCSVTGSPASTMNAGAFKTQSGGGNVTVNSGQNMTIGSGGTVNFKTITVRDGGTLTFLTQGANTEYKINKLEVKGNATVNFVAGDYWVKSLIVRSSGIIKVSGSGTARLYANNNTVTINTNAQINYNSGVANAAKQFFLYGYGNVRLRNDSKFTGFIYAANKLDIDARIELEGAGLAKEVDLGTDSTVTFDATAKSEINLGTLPNLFDGGLQTHGAGANTDSDINFSCGASVVNNPTTALTSKSVINPCINTCGNSSCSASGTPINTLDAGTFKIQSGGSDLTISSGQNITLGSGSTTNYRNIIVQNGGTATFLSQTGETEYKLNKLDINDGGKVSFVAGNYWINNFIMRSNSEAEVIGLGTARVMAKNNTFTLNTTARLNYNTGVANAAKQLLLYGYGDVRLRNDSKFVGFIYATNKLDIDARVEFTGAGLGREVDIDADSVITYDSTAKDALDFGFFCPIITGATHFELNHSNDGIFCYKHRVTVTAKDNANTITNYNYKIALNTGTGKGTWTVANGNGSLDDSVSDDGYALYTFSTADSGVAEFDLDYTNGATTVDLEVYEKYNTVIRDDDNSGNITFSEYNFVLSENAFNIANPPASQTYSATQTAGVSDDIHITAYGQKTPAGACGIVDAYDGNKNLKFWQDYIDPNSGTLTSLVNSTAVGNAEGAAVTVPVSFNNGEATISSMYRDVGKIKLKVKDDSVGFALKGETTDYVVKPAKLTINVTGNPGAADHNGTVFKKAGEAFTATVTAQDNDDNTTPNFGNESTPETVKIISSTLVAPVDGQNGSNNDGTILNGDALTKTAPGIFTGTNLSFDEVGIIKLRAEVTSQNYLGVGPVQGLETENVGRFIPYEFTVSPNIPLFETTNSGGFTYLDQKFIYQVQPVLMVTAKSMQGTTTLNYKNDFWKINPLNITQSYSSISTLANFDSSSAEAINPNVVSNNNGTGTITYSAGTGVLYSRINGIDLEPFNAEIKLSTNILDSDGVAYNANPYNFGDTTVSNGIGFSNTKKMYHGRLTLNSAGGSSDAQLSLAYRAEYYDGNSYVQNILDNDTSLGITSNIKLSGSLTSSVVVINPLSNGQGSITIDKPSGGTSGNIIVEALLEPINANLPYLQYDWETTDAKDGLFDDNPQAVATFGIYEGNKNIIFMREVVE